MNRSASYPTDHRMLPQLFRALCGQCCAEIFGKFALAPLNQYGAEPLALPPHNTGVPALIIPPWFATLVYSPQASGLLDAYRVCANCVKSEGLMFLVPAATMDSRLMDLEAAAKSAGFPVSSEDAEDSQH